MHPNDGPVVINTVEVFFTGIALIVVPVIMGISLMKFEHDIVPVYLGYDTGSCYAQAFFVGVFYGMLS